ncbi:MAG: YceI family protein [Lapillicoccus sp.]
MSNLTDLTPGSWTIDPAHSEVAFVARHLMVAKVRGKFTDFTGTITVGDSFEDSTVQATVKLASVDTGAPDRDAHLRSADFFDVENTPDMTFASTKVSEGSLDGDLTIKGVTRPVTLDLTFNGVVTDPYGNTKAGFEAETEISRKEWGLTWNAALEGGGVVVSDTIKVTVDVELLRA